MFPNGTCYIHIIDNDPPICEAREGNTVSPSYGFPVTNSEGPFQGLKVCKENKR